MRDQFNPTGELCAACGKPAKGYAYVDDKRYCHGDEPGETCYERGQGFGLTAADAVELGLAGKLSGWIVEHRGDWPMPNPPPYPADDEGLDEPDEREQACWDGLKRDDDRRRMDADDEGES